MLVEVKEPTWDKKKRRWILNYVVDDKDIGIYTQTIECEALISASNIYQQLIEHKRRQR